MQKNRIKTFSTLIISTVFCLACTAGENMKTKGKFVYTDGSSAINTIDFSSSDLHTSSLYKSIEVGSINHLTRISSNEVLFGECPITSKCIIKQKSIDHGEAVALRAGRLPSYILNHDKLFFYDTESDGSNWLFEIALNSKKGAVKIAKEPIKKTLPNGIKQSISIPVIQISNDSIVYVGEDTQLWQYNIVTKEKAPIKINDCRPILWREKYNQLLCSDWETWSPFLLDLNTKRKTEISILKGAYGFVYNMENDALVYGKTRLKAMVDEAYDIFLYSFIDKNEKRIVKDSHIATGVWLE